MKKVLISGFEAFGPYAENSSEVMANLLKTAKIPDFEIHTTILPVTFRESFKLLKKEIDQFKPDYVICLGLAGNRKKIELEKVAINFIHCDFPDNEGVIHHDELINSNGPSAYFSTLPLEKMREVETPFPITMSLSAGAYVCNYLMYRLLDYTKDTSVKAGFIHLPPLHHDREGMLESLERVIRYINE